MGILELVLLSIGLAMDAFAVSICKGISINNKDKKKFLTIGLYFGGFQAIMPLLGYFLGTSFEKVITSIDHYIAFGLLGVIGVNMIVEAFSKNEDSFNDNVGFKTMIVLSIATSIDALAVGITFAFLNVNIWIAISLIGGITFVLSCIGANIGAKFGDKYSKKAEFIGGVILVLIGLKILLEHLGVINF